MNEEQKTEEKKPEITEEEFKEIVSDLYKKGFTAIIVHDKHGSVDFSRGQSDRLLVIEIAKAWSLWQKVQRQQRVSSWITTRTEKDSIQSYMG